MEGQSSLVPRKMEFFTVTPRQWCMIDIDSLAWEGDLSDQQAMLSYASQQLPAEFQATDCWYHLSSSMPRRPCPPSKYPCVWLGANFVSFVVFPGHHVSCLKLWL